MKRRSVSLHLPPPYLSRFPVAPIAPMPPHYRRCISCRKLDLKLNFWRVVRVFPAQTIQLDQGMGRSAYICPQASCLQAAQKKDRLGRVLKARIPEETYRALWQRLLSTQADEP